MLKTALFFAAAASAIAAAAPLVIGDLQSVQAPAPIRTTAQPQAVAPTPVATHEDLHGEKSIVADKYGQYWLDVLIGGERVHMIVDTGASFVSISSDIADRLALPRGRQGYANTANGKAAVTETVLPNIDLGTIYMTDVPALISDRNSGSPNLLGASFLKRLASVEQRNGLLVLQQ